MYTKNQVSIVLFIVLLVSVPVFSFSSGKPGLKNSFRIKWNSPQTIGNSGNEAEKMLSFGGSVLDEKYGRLPVFMKSFPIENTHDSLAELTITNRVFQPVNEADLMLVKGLDKIGADLSVTSRLSVERKKASVLVSFLPLRRNSETGRIERLLSFDINMQMSETRNASPGKSVASYAENSVLASGTWYKFGIPSDGIYRLTYDDLKKAGIDVAAINPLNLRIFGNGGGMLPEANAALRVDDLMENAIFVSGEADGRFDPGDYLLFYAGGPDHWNYNPTLKIFNYKKNIYADRVYYFLTIDKGPGKRIENETTTSKAPTYNASKFEDYAAYEKNDVNLIKSGREWYDKQYFDITSTRTYSFNFPNIDSQSPVVIRTSVAARSVTGNTAFVVSAQGNPLMSIDIERVYEGFENDYANTGAGKISFLTGNPTVDIKLNYVKSSSSSVGYLNFIELNATRELIMNGSQMRFRTATGTAPGGVTEFSLNGGGQNLEIWDVTSGDRVTRINAIHGGNNYVFRVETEAMREFIAFDGNAYNVPEFVARIANQNLHGAEIPDYIIVSHPSFMGEAERLAEFHRANSGLSVLITTPETIYNEFSSGAQDVSAIRDFVRLLYNKATPGNEPRYLLLFGDASYDYLGRTQNNTNFVPSYESNVSLSPVSSYVSDDYFGFLDNDEGQGDAGSLDIGIGRFPVDDVDQARATVDKVIHYCSNTDAVKNDWRNVVTFVSDDQNEGGNLFVESTEALAKQIEKNYKNYNVDKIYSDAYPMVSTPGGGRYPEVNQAINKRVEKGSLIMNYIGHGGEVGWAHERILEVPDIQSWRNYDNMPVFVTATCEFSRFDDPNRVSAGEWVLLNQTGGGVALFTTTRLTFAGTNQSLLVNFYDDVFRKFSGEYLRLGDLLRVAKKDMGSSPNIHAFVLLGDPAMQMAYPNLQVVTTSINANTPSGVPDTLKALAVVTITGEVRDAAGQKAVDFSGTVYPTVFDKSSEIWTRANYEEGPPVQFFLRKNPVYKGKVEVSAGSFTFSFIVPKDIAYKYGVGKISYYASSSATDANGYDDKVQVGGYNNQAQPDDQGPEVELYMNNRDFRSGGVTNQHPDLLAYVSDSSGVNTVGNGIGHDITAILDGKTTTPMILNDYYVSDINTFKSGEISYPLSSLSDGPHRITLKVWDVYNNSTDASIDFLVVSSTDFAFQHLMNYPNPMTDHTTFCWESNQVDQPVEVEIKIVSLNGSPVKTLKQTIDSQGFRTASIQWDGTQDNGCKISSGLYVYQVQLILPDGSMKRQSSKLVVLR